MDTSWIKSALCYHGKPMKKTWEDEYGNDEVQKMGITEDENYSIYTERQKYFIFQDRAKRLKIHQFLAHKSVDLYDSKFLKSDCKPTTLNSDFNNNKCELFKQKITINHLFESFYLFDSILRRFKCMCSNTPL